MGTSINRIRCSYSELKIIKTNRGFSYFNYTESSESYFIFLVDIDLNSTYFTSFRKDVEVANTTDFDTNFKPIAILYSSFDTGIAVEFSKETSAPIRGQKTKDKSFPVVLPSDFVVPIAVSSIPDDLSNQRTYATVIPVFALPTLGAEAPICLFRNPDGSGKNVYIREIYINNRNKTQTAIIQWYHTPTITVNGTSHTANNTYVGSLNTTVTVVYISPTVSSFGTRLRLF